MRSRCTEPDVGIIPGDWSVTQLRSTVLHHNSGIYKKSELYGNGSNIVGVSDLYGIDCVDGQRFAEVPLSRAELAKHTLARNDLLYGESSLVREGIARTVYVTELGAGTAFAWHTRRYAVDQRKLSSVFAYYYLQTHRARKHMVDQCIQTAITGINTVAYFACPVLLPPLPEQRAIASALSDVDALLDGLERLIAKKRDLKQAAMQQLLTGQTRLPGFRGEWKAKKLAEVCSMKSGESITSAHIDQDSPYPCYGGNGLRGRTSRSTHKGCYALVGRQGALCGNVVIVEGQFFASEHAIVVTAAPQTDIRWLGYVLGRMNLNQYSESSAQPGLSVSKVLQLTIEIPPTISEQTAIATVLSDMDAELAALEARRNKTRDLKQAMMQELLTGRIRLV